MSLTWRLRSSMLQWSLLLVVGTLVLVIKHHPRMQWSSLLPFWCWLDLLNQMNTGKFWWPCTVTRRAQTMVWLSRWTAGSLENSLWWSKLADAGSNDHWAKHVANFEVWAWTFFIYASRITGGPAAGLCRWSADFGNGSGHSIHFTIKAIQAKWDTSIPEEINSTSGVRFLGAELFREGSRWWMTQKKLHPGSLGTQFGGRSAFMANKEDPPFERAWHSRRSTREKSEHCQRSTKDHWRVGLGIHPYKTGPIPCHQEAGFHDHQRSTAGHWTVKECMVLLSWHHRPWALVPERPQRKPA